MATKIWLPRLHKVYIGLPKGYLGYLVVTFSTHDYLGYLGSTYAYVGAI
jgi:hypothetical protein